MIRTIFSVLYFALALVLFLPLLILWSLLTGSPDFMYWAVMRAVRVGVRIAGVQVRLEGIENIPAGVCIFAANHTSNVDPLAFIPNIPRRVAILVKKELFSVPILSKAMRMANFVPVDRMDREAAAASVDIAVDLLKRGQSFAVYPEGTRSPDGRLRPFKRGTIVMALESGAPVVPVSIAGAEKLMPKGGWTVQGGEVKIRFGPPVDPSAYSMERRGEMLARLEGLVAAGLPPEQHPVEAPKVAE
jgi:1-acyl-sn-glycerol-3-phosphate acyltransferase